MGNSHRSDARRIHTIAFTLATVFFCYAFLQRVSPAVMVSELMREFSVGAAILGNLSAFYFYGYASVQIPAGVMLDRLGPRRLLTASAVLCAVGSLVFALSDGVAGAYVGRLLIGIGAAFSFPGALALAVLWFPPQRFASLAGITQGVAMVGAVLGTAPASEVVSAIGWRAALLWLAAAGAVLAVLLWLTARDGPRAPARQERILAGLKIAAANPQTWLAAAFGFWMTGPLLAFAGLWGVPYLSTIYGVSRTEAAAVASLLFVGWGISAPLVGTVSDRIGRRRPLMIAGSILAAASLAAVLYIPELSLGWVSVLLFLNGGTGAVMLLNFACAREHNPPGTSGAAIGITNMAVMTSGAVFQPLLGWVLDLSWSGQLVDGARVYSPEAYRTAMSLLPLGVLLSTLAAWLIREPPRPS